MTSGLRSTGTRIKAFDPFFTTKEQGKGTGLGLSTVYRIITHCGGHVSVESAPGQGTAFTILLPRIHSLRDSIPPSLPGLGLEAFNHDETVLVVEDDPLVRRMTRLILSRAGYEVLEASNGEQAIEVARAYSRPIDFVAYRCDTSRF